MLKIAKRANVDEHFIALMTSICQSWMDNEADIARTYPAGPDAYWEANRLRHSHVRNILTGEASNRRSGLGYEITKLRSLQYTDFRAVQHEATPYLMGETKPIIINYQKEDYHLGPYRVYVPVGMILQNDLKSVHMIPLKAPMTNNRYMHHLAGGDGEHPLARSPRTCWGNFGSAITSYTADADIAELFRGLHLFLSRYNAGSPLKPLTQLGWDTEHTWEEWQEAIQNAD